ncbi:transcription factor UPBEAT1 [Magnolia sinica]|uniref:transcription factor UPBEAT1 n=1 Tax=Magnolia sinica TaxID=86752 RepID=UPI00265AA984|nr:transcription factor UPBEAT1 [Magnolia sinica]
MGTSQPSLIPALDLKGTCGSSIGSIWTKVLILQAMRRKLNKRPRIFMRRKRSLLEGSRRPTNGVERRVKSLQKLVPNGESMALDGLFKEAADYIVCLEMQVKAMQVMVNVLSDSNE